MAFSIRLAVRPHGNDRRSDAGACRAQARRSVDAAGVILGKNTRLKDKRAIDVLREGDVAAVVRAASAFGEHGAA